MTFTQNFSIINRVQGRKTHQFVTFSMRIKEKSILNDQIRKLTYCDTASRQAIVNLTSSMSLIEGFSHAFSTARNFSDQ